MMMLNYRHAASTGGGRSADSWGTKPARSHPPSLDEESSSALERPSPVALLAYSRVCPNVLTMYGHCLLHVVAALPVLILETRARPHLLDLRSHVA